MKIAVVGAGSVGIGVAASLASAGADVSVMARGKSVGALRDSGLQVTGVLGEHRLSANKVAIYDINNIRKAFSEWDFFVVATKAYEALAAVQTIVAGGRMRAAPTPSVLFLQNGWGTVDQVKGELPNSAAIFSGSVLTGFERRSPSHVNINVHGDSIRVGSLVGSDAEVGLKFCNVSAKGFLPFVYEPDIEPIILKKLLYNACLNPVGALTRCCYGELAENKNTVDLMCGIADEAVNVIRAARGLSLFSSGRDYILNELIPNKIPKTAAHRSSMLQDIEAGRKTEIAYLNGAISKMGKQAKIPTPFNDAVSYLILGCEDKNSRHNGDWLLRPRRDGFDM
jgi:2-dehydropantoate 2-reductase